MKHKLTTMKILRNGIYTAIIVINPLSLCAAQTNQAISVKVNGLIVKNFPDSEAVFKVLEQGKSAFWIIDKSKPTWDDVKKMLLIPMVEGQERPEDFLPDDPNAYFQYSDTNMVEFTKSHEGKIVIFSIPPDYFETGMAKNILYIKYDDFKKIVNKTYCFEIDF